MNNIWSFESVNGLRATYGLLKVQASYEPHLDFDMGTILIIKRKRFKRNLIDNTFKENFSDNISRIGRKCYEGNFMDNTFKEIFY